MENGKETGHWKSMKVYRVGSLGEEACYPEFKVRGLGPWVWKEGFGVRGLMCCTLNPKP